MIDDPEAEDPGEDQEKPQIVSPLLPQFVVSLEGSEKVCQRRTSQFIPEEQIAGHNDAAGLQRRLLKYNDAVDTLGSCVDFFQDNGVEVLTIDADHEGAAQSEKGDDLFEMVRLYMERDGRPNNYLEAGDVVDKRKHDELFAIEKEEEEARV